MSAASSPTPNTVAGAERVKKDRMMSNSDSTLLEPTGSIHAVTSRQKRRKQSNSSEYAPQSQFCPDLDRSQLYRQFIEHAVDIFVAVRAAVGFGEFHRFIDDCPIRYFRMSLQLIGTEQ